MRVRPHPTDPPCGGRHARRPGTGGRRREHRYPGNARSPPATATPTPGYRGRPRRRYRGLSSHTDVRIRPTSDSRVSPRPRSSGFPPLDRLYPGSPTAVAVASARHASASDRTILRLPLESYIATEGSRVSDVTITCLKNRCIIVVFSPENSDVRQPLCCGPCTRNVGVKQLHVQGNSRNVLLG